MNCNLPDHIRELYGNKHVLKTLRLGTRFAVQLTTQENNAYGTLVHMSVDHKLPDIKTKEILKDLGLDWQEFKNRKYTAQYVWMKWNLLTGEGGF